jgi:acetoin utilization protein AcuB
MLNDIKPFVLSETVGNLLDVMEELKYTHLPLVDEKRHYVGLICEDDLLEIQNVEQKIGDNLRLLKPFSIVESSNLFNAIRMIGEGNLSLLPVVSEENIYKGYVLAVDILQDMGREMTFAEPGSILILRIPSRDYHLAQIAQIVESEDARIVGMHMASDPETGQLLVCLKINQLDLSRILSSFERYNYVVTEVFHQSLFDDGLQDRYQAFMKYLNT